MNVNQELINEANNWLQSGYRVGSATSIIRRLVVALELAEKERKRMIASLGPG